MAAFTSTPSVCASRRQFHPVLHASCLSQKADPETTIIIEDDENYNSKHFVIPPQYAVSACARAVAEIALHTRISRPPVRHRSTSTMSLSLTA